MHTWTPLHLAVQRGSGALPVIAELLRLKADPNTADAVGVVLGVPDSAVAEQVELLVQHRANVNLQTGMAMTSPLGLMAARLAPDSRLLELRANVNGNEQGGLVIHRFQTWPGTRGLARKGRGTRQCLSAQEQTSMHRGLQEVFKLPGTGISSQTLHGW